MNLSLKYFRPVWADENFKTNDSAFNYRKFILVFTVISFSIPDSKAHGANMGHIWGRQDPGGPNVGHMNFAIWDGF